MKVWIARYPCRVHLDPACPIAIRVGARPVEATPHGLGVHGRMWLTPSGPLLAHHSCAPERPSDDNRGLFR